MDSMTFAELAKAVSDRVNAQAVADLADRNGCSMADARSDLEAEAVAAITGRPVDYHADWRVDLPSEVVL